MPVAAGIAYVEHRGGAPKRGHPPLILIHGAGGSRLVWPPQMRRMQEERVLVLDLPGHGRSPGPSEGSIQAYLNRLLGWMEAVGLDQAVLGGHSMGGAIALLGALTVPERVAGLVLISTGGRLRVAPAILEGLSDERGFRVAADSVHRRWFTQDAPARMVDLSLQRLVEVPRQVLLDDFRACNAFDVLDRLGEITAPALVLCGLEDQMTSEKYSRYLAYQIPNATLEFIPRAGHMVLLERPEAVTAAVRRFMQRTYG